MGYIFLIVLIKHKCDVILKLVLVVVKLLTLFFCFVMMGEIKDILLKVILVDVNDMIRNVF